MIAAAVALDLGRAAELAHPHDQRVVQHAALGQIGQQRRVGRVDLVGRSGVVCSKPSLCVSQP